MTTTVYKTIGLTMKVGKHLQLGNYDKAAMYCAARSFRDGKPTDGSPEAGELDQLKGLGYKFYQSPGGPIFPGWKTHGWVDGDIVVKQPNGRFHSGRSVLKDWDELGVEGSE